MYEKVSQNFMGHIPRILRCVNQRAVASLIATDEHVIMSQIFLYFQM